MSFSFVSGSRTEIKIKRKKKEKDHEERHDIARPRCTVGCPARQPIRRGVGPRSLCAALLVAIVVTAATGAGITFAVNDHNNKPVADAVVSLVPLDEPAPAAPPAGMVEVEQKGQEFLPYVTAVRAGTTVKFPNRDTIEHHVYSQSAARKFELPLYKPGRAETLVFDRPGIVAIGCNIHDWMLAYVVVLPTPWFAITPASGTAKLSNMPAGRFRAEVWHPRLGKTETREVTLSAAATDTPLSFKLTLKPDRRIRRLPDAAGQGYR